MDLEGTWRATLADDVGRRTFPDPDHDDQGWETVAVPGHWRSVPAFAGSDGPVFYRRRFSGTGQATGHGPAGGAPAGRRWWLTLDGVFYQGDVWLDGAYLGDTEGYFAPHTFEVTDALAARTEHLLAVEVACSRPEDRRAKSNLTGVFQHGPWIDPSWNPGGIWAPVALSETGPVRIAALRVSCRDARAEQAALDVEVDLDAAEAVTVELITVLRSDTGDEVLRRQATESLSAGPNLSRWRVTVERPRLWWPHAMGDQPLYQVDVEVRVTPTQASDRRSLATGLRQVRLRNFVATVNGERLFLKGAAYGPTRREMADVPANRVAGDVALAVDAGLDLLRVHAHVGRPELYDAADRAGLLLWQDLPLLGGYANVRRQAVRQARQAVSLLCHHPSILLWCGHDEPLGAAAGAAPEGGQVARQVVGAVVPSWNRSALDRSVRRALEKADGSRPTVARSGVLPHPAGGTDSHLSYGWATGEARDLPAVLARLPVLARFVASPGAQAVPDTDGWMDPGAWPDLDWAGLEAHHGLQLDVVGRRVPPGRSADLARWRMVTQAYQAELLRYHVEVLRRLKYRPAGGFCLGMLADAQPAVSAAVLDHRRLPKAGYAALAAACAPVVVVADRPRSRYRPGEVIAVDVHVVNDLRGGLQGAVVTAEIRWRGGQRQWRFGGEVGPDTCVRIGRLELGAPPQPGRLTLALNLTWDAGTVANRYSSTVELG